MSDRQEGIFGSRNRRWGISRSVLLLLKKYGISRLTRIDYRITRVILLVKNDTPPRTDFEAEFVDNGEGRRKNAERWTRLWKDRLLSRYFLKAVN